MAAQRMADAGDPAGRKPPLRLVVGAGLDSMSDLDLVRLFIGGEERAFGELVRRHERLVYGLVRRYARTPEETFDLAQKAFLRSFAAARRVFPRLSGPPDVLFKA